MRRSTLLLVGIIFIIAEINAQFSTGIKAGLLSNNTRIESGAVNLDNLIQPMAGYSVGGFVNYNLQDRWEVSSGLLYKHVGFKISEGTSVNVFGLDIPVGATVTTTVNYLEVPLLLRYVKNFGDIKGYISAGPSINYALNGQVRTTANSIIDFNVNTTSLNLGSDSYSRLGLAGNMGLGIEYPTSDNVFLRADINYSVDFSSLVEVPVIDAGVRNRGLGFSVGVGKRF